MGLSSISRRQFTSLVAGAGCLSTPALGAVFQASGAKGQFYVDRVAKKRVRAVMTYQVRCPNMQATQWSVFTAVAPSFSGQNQTTSRMIPKPVETREKSPQAREILGTVLKGQGPLVNTLQVGVTYEATLFSRVLRPLPQGSTAPKVIPLTPLEQKNYLASRGDINHATAPFTSWLTQQNLRREKDESDLDFAYRAYLHLKGIMEYDYQPLTSRVATHVCAAGRTDCGGLSILFVSVMRAAGIPARVLYGRWAESAKPDSRLGSTPYYQWHVKSEFFAKDIGWIPVDLSGGVEFDKNNPRNLDHFGNDPGNFITFHFDPNLVVDSVLFGPKQVHNLQYPMWWWTGSGSADPKNITEGWQVAELFPDRPKPDQGKASRPNSASPNR